MSAVARPPHPSLGMRLVQSIPSILRRPRGLLDADALAFWTESRRQFDRWQFILGSAVEATDRDGELKPAAVETAVANAAAVFLAEPVVRAWAAVLCEFDARRDRSWRPLVLRAFEMLLAARLDALRLMTHATALPPTRTSDLDALRRRTERRTDWLLAALTPSVNPDGFGFSPDRIRDFALDAVRIGGDQAAASLAALPIDGPEASLEPAELYGTIDAALARFEQRFDVRI